MSAGVAAVSIAMSCQFWRYCVRCQTLIPLDRLARDANTCSNECGKADRAAKRRFKHALRKEQYQASLKRKLSRQGLTRMAHTLFQES